MTIAHLQEQLAEDNVALLTAAAAVAATDKAVTVAYIQERLAEETRWLRSQPPPPSPLRTRL